ncbi:NADPH-dependent FMN reductase [Nocardiopsis sp. NPDC006938]|uniref:NADPH-dependent FMN reductase n=1 Tax=Nocardiopsis sp. NPDC006938 TaxID=3364337 RepID=UPI003689AD33
MSTTVLVGNPRPGSRTSTAAGAVARHAARAAGLPPHAEVVELADLAPLLLSPGPTLDVRSALDRVSGTDLLVVASPTRKATYSGLLKVFLDLLPHRGLAGVTAVPVLLTASPPHTLAVDAHLRPLLLELGATVPAPGLALLRDTVPEDPGHAHLLDPVLAPWADAAARGLRAAVRSGTTV